MSYSILIIIVIAIFTSVLVAAVAKEFRRAFLVLEGYAGLLYNKGKYVEVLGMPGGFVPKKNGKSAPAGEAKENGGAGA